jgi:hypothetical protein
VLRTIGRGRRALAALKWPLTVVSVDFGLAILSIALGARHLSLRFGRTNPNQVRGLCSDTSFAHSMANDVATPHRN